MIIGEIDGARNVLVRDDQVVHRTEVKRHVRGHVHGKHKIVFIKFRDTDITDADPAKDAAVIAHQPVLRSRPNHFQALAADAPCASAR